MLLLLWILSLRVFWQTNPLMQELQTILNICCCWLLLRVIACSEGSVMSATANENREAAISHQQRQTSCSTSA